MRVRETNSERQKFSLPPWIRVANLPTLSSLALGSIGPVCCDPDQTICPLLDCTLENFHSVELLGRWAGVLQFQLN